VSTTASEYFGSSPKKGRGLARATLDLVDAIYTAAEKVQPVTGRGVAYKLFISKLIASMARPDTKRVYRALLMAREEGFVPWEWIVDETRDVERVPTWDDPEDFAQCVAQSYRRDFWNQQPVRVEVWSEKGTVRGVLAPVLDRYAVPFRVLHGYSGATPIYNVAQDSDGRPVIPLYVGDYDPSGMHMSEVDLPTRLTKYGGDHVALRRIALVPDQLRGLPSFPASEKSADTRYRWFVANYGKFCWELDAMDPNDLRAVVEAEIVRLIEPIAWQRCEVVNQAEQESLRTILDGWRQ
jgi:hypothetical protein